MESPEAASEPQTGTRTLLLAALLLAALQATLTVTLTWLVVPLVSSGGYSILLYVSGANLSSFIINPVLLFYVFYRLGKKVPLAERYVSVGASLFVGGVLGYTPPYFLLPVAFGSSWSAAFPDSWSLVATTLGFLFIFVRIGLESLFPGFVAIAVANFRARAQTSPSGQTA